MMSRFKLSCLALVTLAIRPDGVLSAQTPQGPDSRRAYASRVELEATLAEAEKVVASPGYSARLRQGKGREAETLRQRLRDGDFQVGDKIMISVVGETQFTDSFVVAPGRMLTLPGTQPVPLQGILRHEAEAYLTEQLKRVLRNPEVKIVPMIRLSVLGQVGRPGFYQFPADMVIADAIMQAGGPTGGANPSESTVKRSGTEIVSEEEFALALERGQTLDQLNLRAGDEMVVSRIGTGFQVSSIRTVTLAIGGVASLIFLAIRIF